MSTPLRVCDNAMHRLFSNAMIERAEELRAIHGLAVVEKHAPVIESHFRQSAGENSTIGTGIVLDVESNVQSAPSNPGVASELNQLSTVRRVSGITSRFRNSLEGLFGTVAADRRRLAPPQQVEIDTSIRRNQRPVTLSTEPLPTPAPPLVRQLEADEHDDELRRLIDEALVGRRLRNSRFTDRLERMLRSRVTEPGEAQDRAQQLHELLASRRARSAERTSLTPGPASAFVGHDALQSARNERYAHVRHDDEGGFEARPSRNGQSSDAFGPAAFQLLLSMQRTLQQEVSAALHRSAQVGKEESAAAFETSLPKYNLGACVICCDKEVSTAFYRCGHMCSCAGCAYELCSDSQGKCPICRAPVREVLQVFLACAPGTHLK